MKTLHPPTILTLVACASIAASAWASGAQQANNGYAIAASTQVVHAGMGMLEQCMDMMQPMMERMAPAPAPK